MNESRGVPNHIGFILDGNRRWARKNGLPTLEGHRQGYDNLRDITKAAVNRGVKFVSAFVFSTENWNRTPKEVKYLMDLSYRMLTRDVRELNKEQIRVVWLGSRKRISQKLLKVIKDAEDSTLHNTRGTLALCFNYGGLDEIAHAARIVAEMKIPPEEITPETIASNLYAPEVPPLDMIIRTSGEQRLSGFMLYRAAYAELFFVDNYWPDFSEDDLDAVLAEYAARERRFGK